MIVGITGTIASGKSIASKYFLKKGYSVIEADQVTRDIQNSKEVLQELEKIFGSEILLNNGQLNRKLLREQVFAKKEQLQILNKIMHPRIRNVFETIAHNTPQENIVFFDLPLLFEAGFDDLCDIILLIYAKKEIQIERIMKRDGSSKQLAQKIIESQQNEEEKKKKADYILENSSSLEEFYKKLEQWEENLHENCSPSRK